MKFQTMDQLQDAMRRVNVGADDNVAQSMFQLEFFLRDGWEDSPIDNLSGALIEMSNGVTGLMDWCSTPANIEVLKQYTRNNIQVSSAEEDQMRQCALRCGTCIKTLAGVFANLANCLQ